MLDENDEKSSDEEKINYNKQSHVKKQLKKGKAVDERTPTTASKKQSEGKKDLLKTSSRKAKKKLIGELTFVEPHLDTFYIGLNDGWKNHLVNPMQAKVLGVENANELAKNWVNPDTNLLRSRKKSKIPVSNSTHNNRTTKADNRKYCPLEFVETETDDNNQIAEINEVENEVEKPSLLRKVANDMDKTDFICSNKTPLKSARILANDTPVEYYGISMIERRKLGI